MVRQVLRFAASTNDLIYFKEESVRFLRSIVRSFSDEHLNEKRMILSEREFPFTTPIQTLQLADLAQFKDLFQRVAIAQVLSKAILAGYETLYRQVFLCLRRAAKMVNLSPALNVPFR